MIAVLPGLEEENDVFTNTFQFLEKVRNKLEPNYFFNTLFLVLTTVPSRRLYVLNYLIKIKDEKTPEKKTPIHFADDSFLMKG